MKEKKLGPDALAINKKDFTALLENSKSMVKTVLTDQSAIAGIGNVYADEILYQAKVHPREKASQLPGKKRNTVFDKIQEVLKTAIEKNADVSELPENFMLPVRKKGNECPLCKSKIETTKISGRTTCFCPSCQKPPD
jgi:formamidopyrimidine-DNA glycosylase